MAITTNTIFPNSSEDIDRIIILFSDDESLVNLSRVNEAGNRIITNIFFRERFNAQHPILARTPFKFEKLCNFFPDSCWKIACCAFSKGKLRLSRTFIAEHSPNIHKFILSEKMQTEAEQRNICGSFCQDPNSPIDQARKAYATIKELDAAYNQRLEPFVLEGNGLFEQLFEAYPDIPKLSMVSNFSFFSTIVNSYTDEQILNPTDAETITIHDDLFNVIKAELQNNKTTKSDDEIRAMVDQLIARGLSDLNTVLSSHSDLSRRICKLIAEMRLLTENRGYVVDSDLDRNDIDDAQRKYAKLEERSVSCVNKLERIGELLAAFDSSGEIYCFARHNPHTSLYSDILESEFHRAQRGEIAVMRLPHLGGCLKLIKNLKHPGQTPPGALDKIRQMINSCDIGDRDHIWGNLYLKCANDSNEPQWSENHFHEFLGPLEEIVGSVIRNYELDSRGIAESNREDPMFQKPIS